MFKSYNYKIQWLLSVRATYNKTAKKHLKELKTILEAIEVRSLTKICLRDKDYKIVDTYSNFISYPTGAAEQVTMGYIERQLKNNADICYVELIRK